MKPETAVSIDSVNAKRDLIDLRYLLDVTVRDRLTREVTVTDRSRSDDVIVKRCPTGNVDQEDAYV